MAKGYIAIVKHNGGSEGELSHRKTYKECVDIVHNFFLSYGFEIKDGKAFDEGNHIGDNDGFEVFTDVVLYRGKVANFTHCEGDGPIAEIRKSN